MRAICISQSSDVVYAQKLYLYPGRELPCMGYIGTCVPKGYGFSAVLVINRVSILADFVHIGHK